MHRSPYHEVLEKHSHEECGDVYRNSLPVDLAVEHLSCHAQVMDACAYDYSYGICGNFSETAQIYKYKTDNAFNHRCHYREQYVLDQRQEFLYQLFHVIILCHRKHRGYERQYALRRDRHRICADDLSWLYMPRDRQEAFRFL